MLFTCNLSALINDSEEKFLNIDKKKNFMLKAHQKTNLTIKNFRKYKFQNK